MAVRKRKDDLESEIMSRQNSIAKFEKNRPFTGSINNDIGTLLATREDRRGIASARNSLDTESQIAAQMRGQDIQQELGLGETATKNRAVDADFDKNRVTEAAYKGQLDLGMEELGLNRDVFKAAQERYNRYGEPLDQLGVARQAARDSIEYGEYGMPGSPELAGMHESYTGVAKPEAAAPIDENSIYYNSIPNAPEDDGTPEWLKPVDYRKYNLTGAPAIDTTLGALNEGAKSLMRPIDLTTRVLDETFGTGVARPTKKKVRNSLRAKVRRVN